MTRAQFIVIYGGDSREIQDVGIMKFFCMKSGKILRESFHLQTFGREYDYVAQKRATWHQLGLAIFKNLPQFFLQ